MYDGLLSVSLYQTHSRGLGLREVLAKVPHSRTESGTYTAKPALYCDCFFSSENNTQPGCCDLLSSLLVRGRDFFRPSNTLDNWNVHIFTRRSASITIRPYIIRNVWIKEINGYLLVVGFKWYKLRHHFFASLSFATIGYSDKYCRMTGTILATIYVRVPSSHGILQCPWEIYLNQGWNPVMYFNYPNFRTLQNWGLITKSILISHTESK